MSEYNYREIWQEVMNQFHEEYKAAGPEQESQFLLWFNFEYIEDTIDTISIGIASDFLWKKINDKGIPEKICNRIKELTGQPKLNLIPVIKNTMISKSFQNNSSEKKEDSGKKNTSLNENLNSFIEENSENTNKQVKTENKKNISKNTTLNPNFTFENFITDSKSASSFAYSVALSVAQNPGVKKNPILLYGGVGLGKTHLMQAIGNKILELFGDDKKICYIQAESFTNDFTKSLYLKKPDAFKDKYRKLDVLLIDDIHFLQGKPGVQEELFYTFEALKNAKAQMVFTCDRPLKEIQGMAERLVSRLGSGMCLNLNIPSYETRKAIIYNKIKNSPIEQSVKNKISDEVIDYIARTIETNVRDLESAIEKITGYQEFIQEPISLEQAQAQLDNFYNIPSAGNISVENIKKVIAENLQITVKDLTGPKRTNQIAIARHIAFYLTREMTELSLADIGNEFGGRDHSSVLSGIKRIEEKIKTDENLKSQILYLKKAIKEYKN